MNERIIECRYCDRKITFKTSANFNVFCPNCKRELLLECEYGFGPVTPCNIWIGEELFATVKEKNLRYYMEMESKKETIELKESYLEALYEAGKIVVEKIAPYFSQKTNEIKISKQGGSLCFYGDWFGRPYDNYHRIKKYSYLGDILEVIFEEGERLIVIKPFGIINTEKELRIESAQEIRWIWYESGKNSLLLEKKRVYSIVDGKIYRNSKNETSCCITNQPNCAVLMV